MDNSTEGPSVPTWTIAQRAHQYQHDSMALRKESGHWSHLTRTTHNTCTHTHNTHIYTHMHIHTKHTHTKHAHIHAHTQHTTQDYRWLCAPQGVFAVKLFHHQDGFVPVRPQGQHITDQQVVLQDTHWGKEKDVSIIQGGLYTTPYVPILRVSSTSNSDELRVRCVPATWAALKITDITGAFSFTVTWCTPLPSTCTAMVIWKVVVTMVMCSGLPW